MNKNSIFFGIMISSLGIYMRILTGDFAWLVFAALTWISLFTFDDIAKIKERLKKLEVKNE